MKALSSLWPKLIGDIQHFERDHRAFNAICIISIIILAITIPFNIAIGLHGLVNLVVVLLVSLLIGYYLSRFKNFYKISKFIFALLSFILLISVFLENSGSQGPALYFLILSLLLIISFTSSKNQKIWLFIHIIVIASLLFFEFFWPEKVPYTYNNKGDRFVDLASSAITVLVCIYFITVYLRQNYENEQLIAEENAKLIAAQNTQLQALNDEKTKLLSILSHDLKSPLNSITMVLNMLTSYELPEAQKTRLTQELLNTTRNTSEMLVNLLSWSSNQLKGLKCVTEKLNLSLMVQNVLQVQDIIASQKQIKIEVKIDDNIFLLADSNMMELTLRNLVNNAIKFTPPLGHISISANLDDENNCIIVFRDNGIGMSQELLDTLFKMDIHSTYGTNNEKGIGLGLVLCKEFTELQGGSIWVHSQLGSGSIFYLKMPLYTA